MALIGASQIGLVGLDPVRAEQRTHDVHVAILARDERWRDSIGRGLAGLDPVRAEKPQYRSIGTSLRRVGVSATFSTLRRDQHRDG